MTASMPKRPTVGLDAELLIAAHITVRHGAVAVLATIGGSPIVEKEINPMGLPIKKYRELLENVRLMEIGDPPLQWDVDHIRAAADRVRSMANTMGRKVKIKCDPPMKVTYEVTPGRLTILRVA